MPDPRPTVPMSAAPGLPIDADEPVFHAPWQAKAFAMTVSLHAAGVFEWSEWTEVFSTILRQAPTPEIDAQSAAYAEAYYSAWQEALEALITAHGIAPRETLSDAAETWKRAAEATPHGKPILFEAGVRASRIRPDFPPG